MRTFNDIKVIGVDHGYGNIKTANTYFPAGLLKSDIEPTFKYDLLVWNNIYYSIGIGHKEFIADKFLDEDYYVMTLAAIAKELARENLTEAKVFIAAGLPLTWLTSQKERFKEYLLKEKFVDFTFKEVEFHIEIVGAEIHAQGFAAVSENIKELNGVNLICDIGNGTMNLLKVVNMLPDMRSMYTEKFGTYQCVLAIREKMMQKYHVIIDDSIITEILMNGTADIDEDYLETIIEVATEYTENILRRLREHEYDPRTVKLYIAGGGSCLIENFADMDMKNVTIYKDICANAKGFEHMTIINLRRKAALYGC